MREISISQQDRIILIADSSVTNRRFMGEILEQESFNVLEARDGREALAIFAAEKPELVIANVVLPELDGLEVCSRIKKNPKGQFVPVLMCLSHTSRETIEQAFIAGAADFICQPVHSEELLQRVKRLIYLREREMNKNRNEIQLRESLAEIQTLSRRVLNAFEEERVRLAREMHDELGMQLTTIKLKLQILNGELNECEACDGNSEINEVLTLVDNVLAHVADKSMSLRPPALNELGLIQAMENMLHTMTVYQGIQAAFAVQGDLPDIPVTVETTVYRCIQEAVTNAVRHAEPSLVSVQLQLSDRFMVMDIQDDGRGFDVSAQMENEGKFGLKGMAERVSLLGGDLMIESAPDAGTRIRIRIPLSME
jgi:two-component system, sensor histidine kinase and response regulator